MRRRRPRKGRGNPPPREATVIRVLIARRQLCFMRRSSRDITFLSLSLSRSRLFLYYILYRRVKRLHLPVPTNCEYYIRRGAVYAPDEGGGNVFTESQGIACSNDDIWFCTIEGIGFSFLLLNR